MSAFDKIIGYEPIKNELRKMLDMILHPEIYKKIGANLPHGVLLYGDPGTGKTTLAKAFIEESGLPVYQVRRTKNCEDFVACIMSAFDSARKNAPSIVFLDDMDKYANEDECHRDAEEYVAIQSSIDDAANSDVFVIGTVNELRKLPYSLTRAGRFDKTIRMPAPSPAEAEKIVRYYLSKKKVSADVDLNDAAKMINYSSCAELENIVNLAAAEAAYERKDEIGVDHIVSAVLYSHYGPDAKNSDYDDENENENVFRSENSYDEKRKAAIHEAGHLVMAEVLAPGSVGMASIKDKGKGGFVRLCRELSRRPFVVLMGIASKAAVELYYSDTVASGCQEDLRRSLDMIRQGVGMSATHGFGVFVPEKYEDNLSENYLSRSEAVAAAEMDRYYIKARGILLDNKAFLEKTADALMEKGTLLFSDIKTIRESVSVVPASL